MSVPEACRDLAGSGLSDLRARRTMNTPLTPANWRSGLVLVVRPERWMNQASLDICKRSQRPPERPALTNLADGYGSGRDAEALGLPLTGAPEVFPIPRGLA
jgi:hypothetical protein